MKAKRTSNQARRLKKPYDIEILPWLDLEHGEIDFDNEWSIDCGEGLPYRQERSIDVTLDDNSIIYNRIVFSAKDGNEGGRILVFIPNNGQPPTVQIHAMTPAVRQRLGRFTPDKPSKALRHFGSLFVNGEPTEAFQDLCTAYLDFGSIPDRLSKSIAKATAELDFLWLQGYAEAIRLLHEEIKTRDTNEAIDAWEKQKENLKKLIDFVKSGDWESHLKCKVGDPGYGAYTFIREAIKEAGGDPQKITIEHFDTAREKSRRYCAVFELLNPITVYSWTDKRVPTQACDGDDIAAIITSITKRLVEGGKIRPPLKSEVLEEVNALLSTRKVKRSSWDSRRLNDTLESLGLRWLPYTRSLEGKA